MNALDAFLAAQAIAWLVGTLLLLALGAWRLPVGLLVVTSWLVGTGALAAERLLLAQLGVAWTSSALALPWVVVALLTVFRLRREGRAWRVWARWWLGRLRRPSPLAFARELAVVAVILSWTAAMVWQATNQPLAGWDAWATWFLKGRALYQAGTLPLSFFSDPRFLPYAHLDYPLLVPLTIAGTYAWTGDLDTLMKGWWPLLVGAAAAGLYWGLAGLVGPIARLGGLLLLLGLPEIRSHTVGSYIGYADLPLAVFVLYGGLFLYRWQQRPNAGAFSVAALFFSLAGFTKNEGIISAGTGLGLLLLLGIMRKRISWAGVVGAGWSAAVFVLPWQWQRQALGLVSEFQPTWSTLPAQWAVRHGFIWDSLTALITNPMRFNYLWPVMPLLGLAAFLFAPRRWLATLPLLILLSAQIGVSVLAYVVSPNDLAWHLKTSADRVVLQSVPLALLLGTLYLGLLLDRRSAGTEG